MKDHIFIIIGRQDSASTLGTDRQSYTLVRLLYSHTKTERGYLINNFVLAEILYRWS